MISSRESDTVNVITQNVLLDYTRTRQKLILPQDDRIGSAAATINNFPGELDIVGIQEAHKSKKQHNGEVLAENCGYGPGFWVNHNQKPYPDAPKGRANEYMGLFGARVDHATPIDIGDNRKAMMTQIAGVAFVTLHLRYGYDARDLRRAQAKELIGALDSYENAVLLGDFNEHRIKRIAGARNILGAEGFESVFDLTDQPHPVTSPIEPYKKIISSGRGWQSWWVRHGWSIDDIMIRGPRVRALAAGVLERVIAPGVFVSETAPNAPLEASDHEGLWARLELAPRHD